MATYVLVHGGDVSTESWNRLTSGQPVHTANSRLGGRVWETVTPYLAALGHRTFTPTLIDEHICNLHGHIEQICHIITENELEEIILTGHSYGGMVVTGVAAAMPDTIGRLVYLDAAIPDPGQSLFDFLASGGCEPVTSIPGLEPAMAYLDKLDFDPEKVKTLRKVFIRCTKSELADFIGVSLKKIAADPGTWTILELPAGHICQPTCPEQLASILLGIAT
jgi:pimeloyl-ACP methyl ester carboxylesterase